MSIDVNSREGLDKGARLIVGTYIRVLDMVDGLGLDRVYWDDLSEDQQETMRDMALPTGDDFDSDMVERAAGEFLSDVIEVELTEGEPFNVHISQGPSIHLVRDGFYGDRIICASASHEAIVRMSGLSDLIDYYQEREVY